jgi:hypothetical protein
VIAGAGSDKTNTLAHRVAHRIINGTDPRRILLNTFSRRALTSAPTCAGCGAKRGSSSNVTRSCEDRKHTIAH